MIQLRKNPFSSESIDIPFVAEEKGDDLIRRALILGGYGEVSEDNLKHFHLVVDGLLIDSELVPYTTIEEEKTYLVAPKIQGGEGGQLFKGIAIAVITAAAAYFLGPGAGASAAQVLGSALAVAGVSVAATLALNALIPPLPFPTLGGVGATNSFEGSQMYTIASQQNSAKKFGKVPQVYGTHRIFPNVAANPYTELIADINLAPPQRGQIPPSGTGEIVQDFYCVYDLGYGPLVVSDIKIGDTPINQYSDCQYRLVDPNRPKIDGGIWDAGLNFDFQLYKGDVSKEPLAINLNGNEVVGGTLSTFQVVRAAAENVNNAGQEISLDFVCPQGLYSLGSDGSTGNVSIEIRVEFSKVDQEVWRGYNDPTYVLSSKSAGLSLEGDRSTRFPQELGITSNSTFGIFLLSQYTTTYPPYIGEGPLGGGFGLYPGFSITQINMGLRKGQTYLELIPAQPILVGSEIRTRTGQLVGIVTSIINKGGGIFRYNFAPLPADIVAYTATSSQYGFFIDGGGTNATTRDNLFFWVGTSSNRVTLTSNKTKPFYSAVAFTPREIGTYKVRITRIQTTPQKTFRVFSDLSLVAIQTRFNTPAIITDKRHVFLELKIRATNQLNGAIQNLSAVVSSVLDVYNPGTQTWQKQITANPAWVFADLMTGQINKRPISKDRLHTPSLLEWAAYCDEIPPNAPDSPPFVAPRYGCNFVQDFESTLQSMINTVSNSYQASLNIIDGKYGVLIDREQLAPVQVFTTRNSWNFQSSRSYSDTPNGIRVQYIDPNRDWQTNEVVAFESGFNEETAERIDDLAAFGCTSYEQALRYGRYMLAQAKLRQERITIDVDFEHLVCTRGDLVYYAQDVMKAGGTPARVKTVSGNRITIDDGIETSGLLSYGYVFRSASQGILTSTLSVVNSDTFDVNGAIPGVGDIIIIGEVGKIYIECLVKSINPNADLSATLELVEYAPAVYEAESGVATPLYNPQLNTNLNPDETAPGPVQNLIVTENTFRVEGSSYEYYIGIDWDVPTGAAYEQFEIYVDRGQGYDLTTLTRESFYEYVVNPAFLGIEHSFKVVAVSANGNKLTLIEVPSVEATPLRKTARPSNVEALYIDITNQVLSFSWPAVPDLDLKEYLIRYSPQTVGATWEGSIPLLRAAKDSTLASAQGRTGTYFIKAVDLNLNESLFAATALTSIPQLFDLNVIEETDDFPALVGNKDAVELVGGSLVLKRITLGGTDTNEYFPEGFYYYSEFLDLGEIYTVRLQSKIQAEGFTVGDLMSNWDPLSDVPALSNAGTSSWDVETQVRATDRYNVMAEWPSLDVIDPISEGFQDLFTEWRKFTIGDFTGRIFQFRLRLISNVPSVTPRVFSGVVRSDMPDRTDTFNNITAPDTGIRITYMPAFKGPGTSPNIQITQDNAQSGDYYIITDRTLEGFTIRFYDQANNPVERQFDASVKGYGRLATAVI